MQPEPLRGDTKPGEHQTKTKTTPAGPHPKAAPKGRPKPQRRHKGQSIASTGRRRNASPNYDALALVDVPFVYRDRLAHMLNETRNQLYHLSTVLAEQPDTNEGRCHLRNLRQGMLKLLLMIWIIIKSSHGQHSNGTKGQGSKKLVQLDYEQKKHSPPPNNL